VAVALQRIRLQLLKDKIIWLRLAQVVQHKMVFELRVILVQIQYLTAPQPQAVAVAVHMLRTAKTAGRVAVPRESQATQELVQQIKVLMVAQATAVMLVAVAVQGLLARLLSQVAVQVAQE
jgi:hypothetical protein